MLKIGTSYIGERILLLQFETQYELAATFLRIQEHHESRRFRGKTFTLESFMDWYASEFGDFTYFQDWSGFNVPYSAFEPFLQGRFDPLLVKEQRLLDLVVSHDGEPYVIGISRTEKDPSTLEHEVAHALFGTRADYRREVRALVRSYDTTALRTELLSLGYCKQVLEDEVHSYVLTERGTAPELRPLKRALRGLYKVHSARAGVNLARRRR